MGETDAGGGGGEGFLITYWQHSLLCPKRPQTNQGKCIPSYMTCCLTLLIRIIVIKGLS